MSKLLESVVTSGGITLSHDMSFVMLMCTKNCDMCWKSMNLVAMGATFHDSMIILYFYICHYYCVIIKC